MADVPILYRFIATGQDSVASAFKSILSTAQSTSRGVTAAVRETEKAARTARTGARGGATATGAEQAAKRSADAEIREARRAADAKIREEQRALRYVAGIRDRHFAEQQRTEERAERARLRAADRLSRERNASAIRWGAAGVGAVGRVASTAGYFAAGVALSGAGLVGQAAREGMRLQDTSNRLSIAARGAGEVGADPAALRREFENAAIANPGVSAADVASGAAGFVAKTGDLGAARRFASTFATVSSASGATVEDVSNAAADLFQKFDIKTIDEMKTALAALTFQGKAGAFELKDAAAQFAKMSAAASRFGVSKGAEGVKILGGLTQMARSATGSPEQAATAVEATFRQLIAESKQIKGLGVDVFEKGSRSKTRDVRDVLVETIAKSKGDLPKLQKIFGEEGIRGISPLISSFNQAKERATGTEAEKIAAGVTAMREALAKAIDAPGDWAEMMKDKEQAASTAGAQLTAAWESMKAAVSRDAVPALSQIGPAIRNMMPALLGSLGALGPAFDALGVGLGRVGDLVKDLQTRGILPTYEDAERERKRLKPGEKEELSKLDPRATPARLDMLGLEGADAVSAMLGRGPAAATLEEQDPRESFLAAEKSFWETHADTMQNRALHTAIMSGGNAASDAFGAFSIGETAEQAESRKGLAGQVSANQTGAQIDTAAAQRALDEFAAKLKSTDVDAKRGGSLVGDT